MQRENKVCQNCQKDFIIEPDDFDFYEKIKVPPPTWCPECRLMRKMSWRNERALYKRTCDLCGKNMLSIYSLDRQIIVYCKECWYSDKCDPRNYGLNFDFNKSFFEQYKELSGRVPYLNLMLTDVENSDYCNYSLYLKNCYLIFGCWKGENVIYSQRVVESQDVVDSLWANQCQLAYESAYCTKLYNARFVFDAHQCVDSSFLKNSRNCSSCFGGINLRNKSYVFFNKQLSQSDYEKKLNDIDLGSYKSLQEFISLFNELMSRVPNPPAITKNIINSSGDMLRDCKHCTYCFLSSRGESSKFCFLMEKNFRDCYDVWISIDNIEQCYEVIAAATNNTLSKFSAMTYHNSTHLEYCFSCVSSKNSFGCINLKNSQYCILNKQYTKEEYEALVPKIIQQMNDMPYVDKKGRVYKYGEFFPTELSPFCYNETIAQEYFPLTKDQAIEQGYSWKDPEPRNYQIDITTDQLPDNIKDVSDDIVGKVIECGHKGACQEQCTEAFRIIPQELQFYRRMNLPLPRLCPNCRHYQRLKQRNPLKLWTRNCQAPGCSNTFETSYAPDRPEIVYCEQCYLKEVV